MKKYFNHFFTFSYYVFLTIPLFFISIATYSYFSVLNKLGEVPPYEEGVQALEKIKDVTVNIFPVKYGEGLLNILIYAFLAFPVFILINYLLHRIKRQFIFNGKLISILLITYGISLILIFSLPFGGWYMGYILD